VIEPFTLYTGDCLEVMRTMEDASVDSIVTDPPYGLRFMGRAWDYDVPTVEVWREVLRIMKPGAHLISFGGSRTYHRMAVAIEDAGFEVRDQIMWIYGSGFPKALDLGKALPGWEGWKSALKPAHEPIILARKPLDGTIANNVLTYGVGALNIGACRVGTAGGCKGAGPGPKGNVFGDGLNGMFARPVDGLGRFPANVIHDGSNEVLDAFAVFGESRSTQGKPRAGKSGEGWGMVATGAEYTDTGTAARFFYTAKASRAERGEGNTHPTVKPLELMRYLCRLITPKGGVVLDPFLGSGTTGAAAMIEGFNFIGIEMEPSYVEIARRRIEAAYNERESQLRFEE
jgi:hypothetical protein